MNRCAVQQYQLSVMDLTVQTAADDGVTEAVSLQHLASWIHPGLVTALQARRHPAPDPDLATPDVDPDPGLWTPMSS